MPNKTDDIHSIIKTVSDQRNDIWINKNEHLQSATDLKDLILKANDNNPPNMEKTSYL